MVSFHQYTLAMNSDMQSKSISRLLMIATVMSFLLFNCEQETEDDTTRLHPFSGEELVIFSFLGAGSEKITVEAYHTVPVFSLETEADVEDLNLVLKRGEETMSALSYAGNGKYVSPIPEIQELEEYSLYITSPEYGDFRSGKIHIPVPEKISRFDSLRRNGTLEISGYFDVPAVDMISYSSKMLIYGEGRALNNRLPDQLPASSAALPLFRGENKTKQFNVKLQFSIFDTITRIPIDTVQVDSVQLVLYTWSQEIELFNQAFREVNRSFGDGTESIDNIGWTNIPGAHGVLAGFATDTLTIKIR